MIEPQRIRQIKLEASLDVKETFCVLEKQQETCF